MASHYLHKQEYAADDRCDREQEMNSLYECADLRNSQLVLEELSYSPSMHYTVGQLHKDTAHLHESSANKLRVLHL